MSVLSVVNFTARVVALLGYIALIVVLNVGTNLNDASIATKVGTAVWGRTNGTSQICDHQCYWGEDMSTLYTPSLRYVTTGALSLVTFLGILPLMMGTGMIDMIRRRQNTWKFIDWGVGDTLFVIVLFTMMGESNFTVHLFAAFLQITMSSLLFSFDWAPVSDTTMEAWSMSGLSFVVLLALWVPLIITYHMSAQATHTWSLDNDTMEYGMPGFTLAALLFSMILNVLTFFNVLGAHINPWGVYGNDEENVEVLSDLLHVVYTATSRIVIASLISGYIVHDPTIIF